MRWRRRSAGTLGQWVARPVVVQAVRYSDGTFRAIFDRDVVPRGRGITDERIWP